MVNVLFFAELREAVGSDQVLLEADGMTVKQLKEKCIADYKLKHMDHTMIAVNEEYATEETVIKSGDVVAFIPPVSGG